MTKRDKRSGLFGSLDAGDPRDGEQRDDRLRRHRKVDADHVAGPDAGGGDEEARAELELAKAKLDLLREGYRREEIAEARAKLKELEADRNLKKELAERSRRLAGEEVVSIEQAELDEAEDLGGEFWWQSPGGPTSTRRSWRRCGSPHLVALFWRHRLR